LREEFSIWKSWFLFLLDTIGGSASMHVPPAARKNGSVIVGKQFWFREKSGHEPAFFHFRPNISINNSFPKN